MSFGRSWRPNTALPYSLRVGQIGDSHRIEVQIMTATAKYDELSADYQQSVREFVEREVIYCVSMLIPELAKIEGGEYYDDIMQICSRPETVYRAKFDCANCLSDWESDDTYEYEQPISAQNCPGCGQFNGVSDWEEETGDDYLEAYEHWIVSDWLASRLEAKGEMVSKDIHGLTVWGRTCSGQAILLDAVICGIYNELHG